MANVSDPQKRLKSIITSLLKTVECPVCLETVKTPFKLCVSGHGVCLACLAKLEKCPLCQKTFTLENPVCVKSMLESLPHLCRYSDDGCEEVVEPGNDHEMFCGCRPIVCRVTNCSLKVSLNQLLEHYEKQHPEWYEKIGRNESANPSWHYNKALKQQHLIAYAPYWLFKNWFWILIIFDDKERQAKFFFQATPIGKLEHDYYVRIKFEKDNFSYSYTLKAFVLSLCEIKYEREDDTKNQQANIYGEQYCMRLPYNEIHRFTNGDGLEMNFFFFPE